MGNPEGQYINTPHNAGFACIDILCHQLKVKMKHKLSGIEFGETIVNNERIVLAKPLTYMNLSGDGVRNLKEDLNFEDRELFVVYDDIDLPLTEIRIRKQGSAGNHKGMKSIIENLEHKRFPRLRIGIADPSLGLVDMVEYVLTPFRGEQFESLCKGVNRAVDAILELLESNINSVMNKYNRRLTSLLPEEAG